MPFVPALNTALVELRMLYDSQNVENTLWVQSESAWDADSLTSLANNMRDWWIGSYANLVVPEVSLREVVCTDMTTDSSGQITVNGGGGIGVVTGDGFPGNVSATASFRTALRGRSFRGRNYIVGVPVSERESVNHLTEDYVANIITQYSGLIAAALPGTQHWSVVSRFSGVNPTTHQPIPRTAAVITPIITVVVVDDIIDSQRRRLPGRGA